MKTFSLLIVLLCIVNINTKGQNLKKRHICWGSETEKFYLFQNRKVYSYSNNKFTFLYKMRNEDNPELYNLKNEIEDLEYELHTNNEIFVEEPDNIEAKKREKELKEEIAKKKDLYKKENIPMTQKAFKEAEKIKSISPEKHKKGDVLLEYFDGKNRFPYRWDNARKKGNIELIKLFQFFDYMNQFI